MIKVLDSAKTVAKDLYLIEKACFSHPWTENVFLSTVDTIFYVYFDENLGKAVGYISVKEVLGEGYIGNIAVLPEYRRKGIGKSLIETAKQSKKLSFLTLEVRKSNTPAINLYTKCGFTAVGERKNFYRTPNEDAVIMTYYFGEK